MDFRESPEHERFRRRVRDWLSKNLPPGWGTPGYRGPESAAERMAFTRRWQKTLYDGGWAGIDWPDEYSARAGSPDCAESVASQDLRDVLAIRVLADQYDRALVAMEMHQRQHLPMPEHEDHRLTGRTKALEVLHTRNAIP